MNAPKLNVLPPLDDFVETIITMETINYVYGGIDDSGDREVNDESKEYEVSVKAPRITFLDWIETLCSLQNNGVTSTHMYAQNIVPYSPPHSPVWGYFDQVKGNLFTNGHTYRNQDKVRIYVYLLEEFNYFAILRILSHQDIVSYSMTKSELVLELSTDL